MYSVKKILPKDRLVQDACGAVEDYLKESDKKDNSKKIDNLSLLQNKNYKKYTITNLKNISIVPNLEEGNFIDIIKNYKKYPENLYINSGNIFNEFDTLQNEIKTIISKSLTNESNKEKEEISQNTEKIEILEDGSICIKNTTGMISPSLGEKYLELKNSNCEDMNTNKEIDQDILVNSKLLVSNNIKCLEDEENDEKKEKEKSYMIFNNSLIKNKNKIFGIKDDILDSNKNIDVTKRFNNKNIKDMNSGCNYVYFSTSKKNKMNSNNNNPNKDNKQYTNRKISTSIRKKILLLQANDKIENKNNNYEYKINPEKEFIGKINDCFIKELKVNNNNIQNELNYKRILFGENFKEEDDIINQWKYLSNKYIKDYNKKLLSNNIKNIIKNLKLQKIFGKKQENNNISNNGYNIKIEENYFDSIKEEYNNIEQDDIAQSINIIEYNNKNESDTEFIFKPTIINYILKPPILNYNNTYENVFEEIDLISEENIKNIKTENYNITRKYQGDIESIIDEEMNESYEEHELNDDKSDDKNSANKNIKHNNEASKKIMKINSTLIDKNKINLEISNLAQNFNKIDNAYSININNKIDNSYSININNKNIINNLNIKKKEIQTKEIKEIDSLSYSPISEINSKIKFINEYNKSSIFDSENVSIFSRETETEMSDEELIFDEKGKIIKNSSNNNSLIYKYLKYKKENINNNDKKFKLVFLINNLDNNIKGKGYSINIKSYKKILKMIFYKKRKPITKNSYDSLISIIINNFMIFKREYILKETKKNYNLQEIEKMNNNYVQINNKIKQLEEKIKEIKNVYIYGLIKKKLIKDKNEKKKFIKFLKIGEKRNIIKRLYKEIINILNNKLDNGEIKINYYEKMIDILKKYEKITDEDINQGKIRYKNKNINNINDIMQYNNNFDKIKNNKKKIFILLLPIMFIINYFTNNYKVYEIDNIYPK